MKILKKRESLIENMAFMGIIAAILVILNSLIALSDMYLPILALFLSLLLPMLVTLVEVSCKDRYYPIFFLTTLLLSFVVTLWNFQATFYYLLPSLISGYIFGLIIKKRVPLVYGLFLSSVIQTVLIYGFNRLVEGLFEIDSIEIILTILKLNESVGARNIILLTIFAFALIEMSFVSLVISFELSRFQLTFNDDIGSPFIIDGILFGLALATAMLYFISLWGAYLVFGFMIYFLFVLVTNGLKTKKFWLLAPYFVLSILGAILFILLNKYFADYSGFLLFGTIPLLIALFDLIFNLLNNKRI